MILRGKKEYSLVIMSLLISYLLFSGQAQAYVYGLSDMKLSNLYYAASDPWDPMITPGLDWIDYWYATLSAHAFDTASGSADDYNEWLGDDGGITAAATTAYVDSAADYTVINGDRVAIDQDASIEASTHSEIEISALGHQGDGEARANFDNYFIITGGSFGDPVEVLFTLDYEGKLEGKADALGYFSVALGGLFQLEDEYGNLLDQASLFEIHSGTATSFYQEYPGTFTLSTTLTYDTPYWLYAEADSEVYGANAVPEPATFVLMFVGVFLLFFLGRYGSRSKIGS